MAVYTKQGDLGKSYLFADTNADSLNKFDIRFSFLGDMDELSSHLGLIKSRLTNEVDRLYLETLQKKLSSIAAALHSGKLFFDSIDDDIKQLEQKIDDMQRICKTKGFVLPGGNPLSAEIDVARTVARRTERNLCAVYDQFSFGKEAIPFLNRLSDFLFAFARYIEYVYDNKKVIGGFEMMDRSSETNRSNDLTLAVCKQIAEKIEQQARAMSVSVAIAFCNKNGNPILSITMDGTLLVGFECALKKAYTAVALKMPTDQAQQLASPGQIFYGLTSSDKLLVIPGGMPIYVNGEIIGSVGVSGGDDVCDVELAKIGSEFFKN